MTEYFGDDEDYLDTEHLLPMSNVHNNITSGLVRPNYSPESALFAKATTALLPQLQSKNLKYYRQANLDLKTDLCATVDHIMIELGWDILAYEQHQRNTRTLFQKGDHYCGIEVDSKRMDLSVWGPKRSTRVLDSLKEAFKKYLQISGLVPGDIRVTFCYQGARGPASKTEIIKCPSWEDIKINYTSEVTKRLDYILSLEKPWEYGRLLILSGEPGTGKTYSIRALVRELRKTFRPVIITDPEILLTRPAYYYELPEITETGYWDNPNPPYETDLNKTKSDRMLIVVEDGASVLLEESRASQGASMARLLNMTDGFIGQSREDIFLITFNEDVIDIDDAFLRPGRCLANIIYDSFSKEAAQSWLNHHGIKNYTVTREMTLAELYAISTITPNKKTKNLVTPKLHLSYKKHVGF